LGASTIQYWLKMFMHAPVDMRVYIGCAKQCSTARAITLLQLSCTALKTSVFDQLTWQCMGCAMQWRSTARALMLLQLNCTA
jgi:hypothetical protein